MNILALSGSARAASTNTALLHGLASAAPPGMTVEVWAGTASLPVFSPDREGPATPVEIREFATRIATADALVVACPEYVHALPGGFKNAIDWLVSREEIIGKPIALLHGSHRGEDVLEDLRRVLSTVSENFLPEVFLTLPCLKLTPEEIKARAAHPPWSDQLRHFLLQLSEATSRPGHSSQEPG